VPFCSHAFIVQKQVIEVVLTTMSDFFLGGILPANTNEAGFDWKGCSSKLGVLQCLLLDLKYLEVGNFVFLVWI
jgi:hypothetical protein